MGLNGLNEALFYADGINLLRNTYSITTFFTLAKKIDVEVNAENTYMNVREI